MHNDCGPKYRRQQVHLFFGPFWCRPSFFSLADTESLYAKTILCMQRECLNSSLRGNPKHIHHHHHDNQGWSCQSALSQETYTHICTNTVEKAWMCTWACMHVPKHCCLGCMWTDLIATVSHLGKDGEENPGPFTASEARSRWLTGHNFQEPFFVLFTRLHTTNIKMILKSILLISSDFVVTSGAILGPISKNQKPHSSK